MPLEGRLTKGKRMSRGGEVDQKQLQEKEEKLREVLNKEDAEVHREHKAKE
jgi:hypothetical protein